MILSDTEIRLLCEPALCKDTKPLIDPYVSCNQENVISYGLTSAGYDLRLGPDVWIFKPSYGFVVDPKKFKDEAYVDMLFDKITNLADGYQITMPAHSYILAHSREYLCLPRQIKGRCVGKSTYARCGLLVNTTPLEPEWEGHLTIEIANISPCPVNLYVGEGIAQLEFEKIGGMVETSYKDKSGKYDKQKGVTPARIKE